MNDLSYAALRDLARVLEDNFFPGQACDCDELAAAVASLVYALIAECDPESDVNREPPDDPYFF